MSDMASCVAHRDLYLLIMAEQAVMSARLQAGILQYHVSRNIRKLFHLKGNDVTRSTLTARTSWQIALIADADQ